MSNFRNRLTQFFNYFQVLSHIITIIREYVTQAEGYFSTGVERHKWVLKRLQDDFKIAGVATAQWQRIKGKLNGRIHSEVRALHAANVFQHTQLSREQSKTIFGLKLTGLRHDCLIMAMQSNHITTQLTKTLCRATRPEIMHCLTDYWKAKGMTLTDAQQYLIDMFLVATTGQAKGLTNFGQVYELIKDPKTTKDQLKGKLMQANMSDWKAFFRAAFGSDTVINAIIGVLR